VIKGIFQSGIFLLVLVFLTPILGRYIARVLSDEKHVFKNFLTPVEKTIYKIISCDGKEMSWQQYTWSLLIFNFIGVVMLFLIQVFQSNLPFNPSGLPGVSWHTALNAAISFVTNTNWQSYSGEITMSYAVQVLGLTVQNFLSAATGISVFLAIIRGIVRKSSGTIGNFWQDITRTILYVLLPLSIIFAIFLTSQGVIQSFHPNIIAKTIENNQQVIPMGPVASQEAIKQLGTNGGGFFNANSSHPFENPTPLSNFIEMLAILLIPSALTYTYGRFVGSKREGRILLMVMLALFVTGLSISLYSEYNINPIPGLTSNMEGKEVRFGIGNSIIWSAATTAASNGSVNSMVDSLTPMAGFAAMFNIMLGEIVFGGVGSGMYGLVNFIILTVFLSGLMVGRTPEFLGKKIESFEVKMAILAILAPNFVILIFSSIASVFPAGIAGLNNPGPHGLSEILYAFSSAGGNNGSSFAGLKAGTVFYDLMTGVGMLIGRYGVIVPVLAIAGNLADKKIIPASSGTFRTDTLLFGVLLTGVILIIGGLTFFPALSLGPLIEHLLIK
jgi:K+-transporting ATPase ATPase A chain